jgi:hypothetical protein
MDHEIESDICMSNLDEQYPRVNFRLGVQIGDEIAVRSESGKTPDSIAKRDLDRYYILLSRSLPTFLESEALFICHALNDSRGNPRMIHRIWVDVCEVLDDSDQVDFNKIALVERLKALTPFECMAVFDAVERYWVGHYHMDDETSKKRLREVGLVAK